MFVIFTERHEKRSRARIRINIEWEEKVNRKFNFALENTKTSNFVSTGERAETVIIGGRCEVLSWNFFWLLSEILIKLFCFDSQMIKQTPINHNVTSESPPSRTNLLIIDLKTEVFPFYSNVNTIHSNVSMPLILRASHPVNQTLHQGGIIGKSFCLLLNQSIIIIIVCAAARCRQWNVCCRISQMKLKWVMMYANHEKSTNNRPLAVQRMQK